jgi:hypothetical protein
VSSAPKPQGLIGAGAVRTTIRRAKMMSESAKARRQALLVVRHSNQPSGRDSLLLDVHKKTISVALVEGVAGQ